MSVAIPEIAKPSTARPWLEEHRHRRVFAAAIRRPELFEQRRERGVQRRADYRFLNYAERQNQGPFSLTSLPSCPWYKRRFHANLIESFGDPTAPEQRAWAC